jgi:hypothetical protein
MVAWSAISRPFPAEGCENKPQGPKDLIAPVCRYRGLGSTCQSACGAARMRLCSLSPLLPWSRYSNIIIHTEIICSYPVEGVIYTEHFFLLFISLPLISTFFFFSFPSILQHTFVDFGTSCQAWNHARSTRTGLGCVLNFQVVCRLWSTQTKKYRFCAYLICHPWWGGRVAARWFSASRLLNVRIELFWSDRLENQRKEGTLGPCSKISEGSIHEPS